MKNVFIGLLIIAAGAGVYFFVIKKKKDADQAIRINKELLIGKWQLTAAEPLKDSAQLKYRFEFQQNNVALLAKGDSVKADTARYEWNKANELVLTENATDSAGKAYAVVKLTADSLSVRSADSVTVLFTRL